MKIKINELQKCKLILGNNKIKLNDEKSRWN